jgi:glyceraldehyde 3-phosphate dehydrogenase
LRDLGMQDLPEKLHQEDLAAGRINFLKTGVLYADLLTTVSPSYAQEILDSEFGMEEGFITTIHAYTNDQRLADAPHSDLRRSRAAGLNIIPTTTGAARAVGMVLPQLKGRLDGMAMRVPVLDGSIVDLVCKLRKKVSGDEINAAVRKAAEGPMKHMLDYSDAPLVSTDIVGNPYSSIFDSLSTNVNGDDGYAKVVSWYDNEWGYSNRVVDLLGRLAAFDA